MYGWLWRALPGPTGVRTVIVVLLVASVVAVCFTWVFPAVAPLVPFNDVTLEEN